MLLGTIKSPEIQISQSLELSISQNPEILKKTTSIQFSVKILGNSGALPAFGRHPTSQIVNHDERLFMVDCGEGTQMRLSQYGVKKGRIEHIFISHLHGDHYFGLPGLITSYFLLGRKRPLTIYGPPDLLPFLEISIGPLDREEGFPIKFHPTQAEEKAVLYEDDQLSISSFPVFHQIPTTGFIFQEKLAERKMLKEAIVKYDIHFSLIPGIKKGDDFTTEAGEQIPNHEITGDPPIPRSYAFCADTKFSEEIVQAVKDCTMIYHEATFTEEHAEDAGKKNHSTAKQAALTAKLAQNKQLIIGHFSAKYPDIQIFQKEARSVFPNTDLALEGYTYDILSKNVS